MLPKPLHPLIHSHSWTANLKRAMKKIHNCMQRDLGERICLRHKEKFMETHIPVSFATDGLLCYLR